MRLVNGYFCRNCADEELAKRGLDPARPKNELSGSEVYVPPPEQNPKELTLGVNQPEKSGEIGRKVKLYA